MKIKVYNIGLRVWKVCSFKEDCCTCPPKGTLILKGFIDKSHMKKPHIDQKGPHERVSFKQSFSGWRRAGTQAFHSGLGVCACMLFVCFDISVYPCAYVDVSERGRESQRAID